MRQKACDKCGMILGQEQLICPQCWSYNHANFGPQPKSGKHGPRALKIRHKKKIRQKKKRSAKPLHWPPSTWGSGKEGTIRAGHNGLGKIHAIPGNNGIETLCGTPKEVEYFARYDFEFYAQKTELACERCIKMFSCQNAVRNN
ncbi:MAG: hypothetical protein ACFFCW_39165 [Candidatus Hodarchaeota archaeon]